MLARHSRSLNGSISANRGLLRLLCCQAAESRMTRCSFFSDQPSEMKRFASQSSSSGCVGGADWLPRSSGVLTKPSPK